VICGGIAYDDELVRRLPPWQKGHAFLTSEGAETITGKLRSLRVKGSEFPIQVVCANGLPEIALTVFANEMLTRLSEGSVHAYLREVLAFANWSISDEVSRKHEWRLYGEPREVRNLLREYLTVVGQCRVTQRPDTLGVRVAYVNVTNQTRINIRSLLAGLKNLYDVLGEKGFYSLENPLVHEDAARALAALRRGQRAAIQAATGRMPMPPVSGVDEPPSDIRLSENYFRLVNREWQPKSIDDPNFPGQVYAAGKRYGWGIRELCAVRTLFESGARISEVFDLTAADWSTSGFTNKFLTRNKGSHGCRVKTIIVSSPTAKLYRRYFDDLADGRNTHMKERVTLGDLSLIQRCNPEQLASIRIFLTARGTPMTARLFRDHYWKPALIAAGIDADPHLCRHWFVTNALRQIERAAKNGADLDRRKQELIQYMAWRSGERTLKAYEHMQRGDSFARYLRSIHVAMHRREQQAETQCGTPRVQRPAEALALDQDLAFLLGEDHDD
jgi:site-specific recombinase XerD